MNIVNEIFVNHSESGTSVPFSILKIPGAMTLFMNNHAVDDNDDIIQAETAGSRTDCTVTRSALATTILESASIYQAGASDRRIGVGPSKNAKSMAAPTGLHKFKNLDKAKSIQAERKSKKADARLLDSGIRVAATVWATDKNKLKQVRY